MIVDTHAHLQVAAFAGDVAAVLERARAAGVERTVVVGIDPESSLAAAELTRQHAGLVATAGVHPCSAAAHGPGDLQRIEELIDSGDYVAVGETGLDWHHRGTSDRAEQLDAFHFHLDLARRRDLPVVIHCRKSFEDLAQVLGHHRGVRGVVHSFAEGPAQAEQVAAAGLHVAFGGLLTSPRNRKIRAAAELVPAELLLVETDSPFLVPDGVDEARNEPRHARRVLEVLAELRGEDVNVLAERTTANARHLFGSHL
ncbi:TatD family hydrolase [Engelhardtia mirabilis]|uniref:Putative deoxyribonuclease YjjV n=1 Tax=Engelhardtia mirabilis TaxID=2528011 RepID=A0A518BP71_9BACT|nr:putative deoxyribonuclease YjjV [Planctomycetes bacterium Pla133]QDV03102.1 putative deoxyribonuclease YjjV [Planctomycetes bacterium Pla86]